MDHPFTTLAPGNWGEVYDKFRQQPSFPPGVNALQAAFAAGVAWEREQRTAAEDKLDQAWEATRLQRDELLAHIAGKGPLPAWADAWLKA